MITRGFTQIRISVNVQALHLEKYPFATEHCSCSLLSLTRGGSKAARRGTTANCSLRSVVAHTNCRRKFSTHSMVHVPSEEVVHRVFLIRHGETVDNIASLYAGSRDSALTNHGVQQAARLGQHLVERSVKFDHIFSSDLSRAFKTAEAIRTAYHPDGPDRTSSLETLQLPQLREQDFGSLEGVSWASAQGGFSLHLKGDLGVETVESMTARANDFLKGFLYPLLDSPKTLQVAVVAHGMILSTLWKAILAQQRPNSITIKPSVLEIKQSISIHHLGGWSNTGYLELEFRPWVADHTTQLPKERPMGSRDFKISIVRVNSKEHLDGLKRTRGGVGSSAHDEKQRSLDSFFKRKTSN